MKLLVACNVFYFVSSSFSRNFPTSPCVDEPRPSSKPSAAQPSTFSQVPIEWTSQPGNKVSEYIFFDLLRGRTDIKGTFVEFGCADGITHSNTWQFEQLGWTGLCIEPNYDNFQKASKVRRNVIHGLVTSDTRRYTYAQMSGRCDQLSGVVEFYSKEYIELMEECKKDGLLENIDMVGAPLENYLEQYGIAHVDWISVDCEGCEASFITTFNFTKYEVQIINYEPNTAARMHTKDIEDSLALHGLHFDRTLQDKIFRKASILMNAATM